MARADPGPVAVRALDQHPLRPHLPDDPADVAAQVLGRLQRAVRVAQEPDVGHADHGRRPPAARPAGCPGMSARSTVGVEAARVAVGADAVGDLDARGRPGRDRPRRPEVDVVRVRGHHQDPLDLAVVQHRLLLSSGGHRRQPARRLKTGVRGVDHSEVTSRLPQPARVHRPARGAGAGRPRPGGSGLGRGGVPDGQGVRRHASTATRRWQRESTCSPTEKPGAALPATPAAGDVRPGGLEHRAAVHRLPTRVTRRAGRWTG